MEPHSEKDREGLLRGVVVTDLVESTRLRARLGDLDADALFLEHDELLGAAVARRHGEIADWLGDGALALFPSVSDAVQAAIAIQQAIARMNRRPEKRAALEVRIGVSGGEVVRSPIDCGGPAVDEATSLCGRSRGARILATERALDLVGTRIDLESKELGNGTVEVAWKPGESMSERLGLPPALHTTEQLPFVGREGAIGSIVQHLRDAMAGDSRVVVVRGDPGVGKTRLAAEIAREAVDAGAAVLFGACREELSLPYAPFEYAFRYWLDHVEDAAERLPLSGGELVRLVPGLAERVAGLPAPTRSDAETERLRLYDAIANWLQCLAIDEPLVLVLDSLHWADEPTLRLLMHLVERLEGCRILIVATYRPEDDRSAQLVRHVAETLGPEASVSVELSGLRRDEVETLARNFVDLETAQRVADALHAATAGNPLHLAQVLRRGGEIRPDATAQRDGIRDALRVNVENLTKRHRRVIEAAAVLGGQFRATAVAELVSDPDEAYEALEAAQRAGLIMDVDRVRLLYRFNHDLTREIVYSEIGAARLARLHERAGLALEAAGADQEATRLVDLARHFVAALPLGPRDKAIRYSASAAERALHTYANEQAEQLFRTALVLTDRDTEPIAWCEYAIGRGEALRRMGDREHRTLLFETADFARERGDGALMARALITSYRGTFSRAFFVDDEYVDRLREALTLIGSAPSRLRARLLALLAVETAWDLDKVSNREVSDESVSVARQLADEAILAEALAHRQWTIYHPLEDRLATTEELARLAGRSTDPLLRFQIAGTEVFTRIRAGDGFGYRQAMHRMHECFQEVSQPPVRWMLLIREFAAALMEARFEDAIAHMEQGRQLGIETAQPDHLSQYIIQRFWLDVETKSVDEARAQISQLGKAFEGTPALTSWPSLAFRCCDLGLDELAAPILQAIVARGLDAIPVDQIWLFTHCQLSAAAAHLGDRELCADLLDRLTPHAREHANVVFASMGSVSRYLGLLSRTLGRLDDAQQWVRRAIDSNADLGAVTWKARCQLDGALLGFDREGAMEPGARQLLLEAKATAAALGLSTLLDQIERQAPGGVTASAPSSSSS